MLLDVVPIGLFHGAAPGINAGERTSGAVGALFTRRGILVLKDPFRLQVKRDFIAFVAKKQGLSAISNEDISVMRDPEIRFST